MNLFLLEYGIYPQKYLNTRFEFIQTWPVKITRTSFDLGRWVVSKYFVLT